jgi:hypothetical protein
MEAPEKIYLNQDDGLIWHCRSYKDDIEYIRTDAFIEKVEDYLNSQLYDWVSVINPDQKSYPYIIPKKDFIDDFKNYMKGK